MFCEISKLTKQHRKFKNEHPKFKNEHPKLTQKCSNKDFKHYQHNSEDSKTGTPNSKTDTRNLNMLNKTQENAIHNHAKQLKNVQANAKLKKRKNSNAPNTIQEHPQTLKTTQNKKSPLPNKQVPIRDFLIFTITIQATKFTLKYLKVNCIFYMSIV